MGNIFNYLNGLAGFNFFSLLVIWIFWISYAFKKIGFWVWLWQLKEYRRDRMNAHFDQESSKKIFFNKIYFLKIILLIAVALTVFFGPKNDIFYFIFGGIYFFIIAASLLFGSGKNKKAVNTGRAKLIIYLNYVFFFSLFPLCFLIPKSVFFQASISIFLAADVLLPFIVTFFSGLITPFVNLKKRQVLNKAAKKMRSFRESVLVIGITGSYGKTSTKELLYEILSKKFKVLKTEANNNTEMGVAKTILEKLDRSYEIFIVEMAAYKKGEIKRICNIVKPTIGIITGIGSQHFKLFGAQENIISAKYEIIEALPEKGLAIFNGDSNFFMDVFKKTKKPKKFYSVQNSQADVFAKSIKEFKERVEFKIHDKSEEADFRANLVGIQGVSNVLGACLIAKELGINFSEMKEIIAGFKPFPKTMELKSGINGVMIIDDSYSGNFEGVISSLNYLKNYQDGKKIIVLYPLIELGALSRDIHKKIGKKIGEVCDLCILVNKDFSGEIKDGAVSSGMDAQKIKFAKTSGEAIKRIKDFARKGDVILLENRISPEIIKVLTEIK